VQCSKDVYTSDLGFHLDSCVKDRKWSRAQTSAVQATGATGDPIFEPNIFQSHRW